MSNSSKYDYSGKRYITLVRVSDESSGTSSIDAQIKLLHDHAERLGMVHVDDIVLSGVTGSMPGRRDDLDELIERKRNHGDFDVLLVQRLDRLTRGGSGHGFWFEHECRCAGIELVIVGDDIPEGRYANLIKVAKYEAAQEQAFSISQRSTQGAQFALEEGRNITSAHTPYACWRLYLTAEGKPSHIIRDLRNGLQQKLDPQCYAVIDTYGTLGGGAKGHYRKQKSERVLLMPGDAEQVAVVRDIYDLHYRQGMGGKRIADLLNRRGIPSPHGRTWSQHQVEVIYDQECYTGRSVGNRTSSAIYHERHPSAPKQVKLDAKTAATAKNIPVRQRPRSEWFVQEQPLMVDFLDPQLRGLAMVAHEKLWQRRGDPGRPKQSKSRHNSSDYVLTGLLYAKQDGEPLVGVLCGRVGRKVRYYRHRRGNRSYIKGSIFNKMVLAEPLERAVMEAAQSVLQDLPYLEQQIASAVATTLSAGGSDGRKLDELRQRREQLRLKIELIVTHLDADTLADAKSQIDMLRTQRQRLDEQIAAEESAQRMRALNPTDLTAALWGQFSELPQTWPDLPRHQLQQLLARLVQKVVIDMETKNIEVHLVAPMPAQISARTAFAGDNALPLVGTSPSSGGYETHTADGWSLSVVFCTTEHPPKPAQKPCYTCRRKVG